MLIIFHHLAKMLNVSENPLSLVALKNNKEKPAVLSARTQIWHNAKYERKIELKGKCDLLEAVKEVQCMKVRGCKNECHFSVDISNAICQQHFSKSKRWHVNQMPDMSWHLLILLNFGMKCSIGLQQTPQPIIVAAYFRCLCPLCTFEMWNLFHRT